MCDCERALSLISLGLDGALTEEERRALDEHLAACQACRSLSLELAGLQAAMPEEEAPPEGFHAAVMEAVRAEKVAVLPVKKRSAWKSWAAMAAVFAVAMVGAGSLWGIGQFSGGGDGAAPPMAAADQGALYGAAPAATQAARDGGAEPRYALTAPSVQAEMEPEAGEPAEAAPAPSQEAAEDSEPQLETAKTSAEDGGAPETQDMPGGGGGNGAGDALPRVALFSANPPEESGSPPAEKDQEGAELTPAEALDLLVEQVYGEKGLPEGAKRVESEDFLGYELWPMTPVGEPDGQLMATKLKYLGLSPNGKYYSFSVYNEFIDDQSTGEIRESILNELAVSLDGIQVLDQRSDKDVEDWDLFYDAISN